MNENINISEIIFQIAEPKHTDDIQNVYFKTWLETYVNKEYGITEEDIRVFFKNAFTSETISKRKKFLENPPENTKFIVAIFKEKIIGLCGITLNEETNQIQSLYVLPEFQKMGIGKSLVLFSSKYFDNTKPTIVGVAIYNINAIIFYKKLGFIETGEKTLDERFKMPISGNIIPETKLIKIVK